MISCGKRPKSPDFFLSSYFMLFDLFKGKITQKPSLARTGEICASQGKYLVLILHIYFRLRNRFLRNASIPTDLEGTALIFPEAIQGNLNIFYK